LFILQVLIPVQTQVLTPNPAGSSASTTSVTPAITSTEAKTTGRVTVVNMAPGTFQIQRQQVEPTPPPKPTKGGSLGLFFRKVNKFLNEGLTKPYPTKEKGKQVLQ